MVKNIDGAKVIEYSEPEYYGFAEGESGSRADIKYLAICQYDGSDTIYLFACDEAFNVLGDTAHTSIDEAKSFAESYYDVIGVKWKNAT